MRWIVRGFLAVALLTLAGLLILRFPFHGGRFCSDCLRGYKHTSSERDAPASLRTLVSAQQDFRDNDRAGDGRKEYWRADVAGLYCLLPRGSSEMIKLIEVSVAGADLAPIGSAAIGEKGPGVVARDNVSVAFPKAGHWFAALRFEDEEGRTPDPDRFVFCAVPDTLGAGAFIYAVTHEGVVWQAQARCARDVPRAFPLDPAAAGWRKRSP